MCPLHYILGQPLDLKVYIEHSWLNLIPLLSPFPSEKGKGNASLLLNPGLLAGVSVSRNSRSKGIKKMSLVHVKLEFCLLQCVAPDDGRFLLPPCIPYYLALFGIRIGGCCKNTPTPWTRRLCSSTVWPIPHLDTWRSGPCAKFWVSCIDISRYYDVPQQQAAHCHCNPFFFGILSFVVSFFFFTPYFHLSPSPMPALVHSLPHDTCHTRSDE